MQVSDSAFADAASDEAAIEQIAALVQRVAQAGGSTAPISNAIDEYNRRHDWLQQVATSPFHADWELAQAQAAVDQQATYVISLRPVLEAALANAQVVATQRQSTDVTLVAWDRLLTTDDSIVPTLQARSGGDFLPAHNMLFPSAPAELEQLRASTALTPALSALVDAFDAALVAYKAQLGQYARVINGLAQGSYPESSRDQLLSDNGQWVVTALTRAHQARQALSTALDAFNAAAQAPATDSTPQVVDIAAATEAAPAVVRAALTAPETASAGSFSPWLGLGLLAAGAAVFLLHRKR